MCNIQNNLLSITTDTLSIDGTVDLDNIYAVKFINQLSGNLNIMGNITVLGDCNFSGKVVQQAGTFKSKGDIFITYGSTINNLMLSGNMIQRINGSFSVNDFSNNNNTGLIINDGITV